MRYRCGLGCLGMGEGVKEPQTVEEVAELLAPVFAANGWLYGDSTKPPGAARIASTIEENLRAAQERGSELIESGRIVVMRDTFCGEAQVRVLLSLADFPYTGPGSEKEA